MFFPQNAESPIRFCPQNPIQISRRAKRGEPFKLAISYVVPEVGVLSSSLTVKRTTSCSDSSSFRRAGNPHVVGREGVEPSWSCNRRFLRPVRLPFRHLPTCLAPPPGFALP